MKPRERFLTALSGGVPDRVPIHEHLFSRKLLQEMLGYSTILYDGAAQAKLAAKLGIDTIWTPINGFCGIEDEPHEQDVIYKDEWGVTYQKNGWPIIAQIDTPIKTREDWVNYKLPEVNTPGRLKILRDTIAANDAELAIVLGILGPFTMMTWYFMDFTNLSMAMYLDPELVHEVMDAFADWNIEVVKMAVAEGGVDAVKISDDWGGSRGLLIAPAQFREFFLKPFEKMVKSIKEMGVPVIMHNDGNIWEILDEIVDTGINALHPVEKAAGMDLKVIKEKYSGRICPIGNVNNKTTMVNGTPEDVIAEVKECIEHAAANGGYVIATDHSLHDDIPTENVMALIEATHKYGTYQIK